MNQTAQLSQSYPILHQEKDSNIFISNNGDTVLGYALTMPEVFTLSKEDYHTIHEDWFRAIKSLPVGAFFHKQDIVLEKSFSTELFPNSTLIQKATNSHFENRKYFVHLPLLFIGNHQEGFLKNYSLSNPFKNKHKADDVVNEIKLDHRFIESIERSVSMVNQSKYLKAKPLSSEEIEHLTENYFNGFYQGAYCDTDFTASSRNKNCFEVGNKKVGVYQLENIKQFPDYIDISKIDGQYSSKKFDFYKGLADDFGFRLPCNHIYNQIIYITNHSLKKSQLKEKGKTLKGARKFDLENEMAGQNIDEYLREISKDENRILIQGHNNVIFYADSDQEFSDLCNEIETRFRSLDFKPKYSSRNIQKELYVNSYPGFSGALSSNRMYSAELKIAIALFLSVTTYKSDEEGVLFSDRVFNIPVKRDIRDEEKKRIKAWNFSIYAPTGEGKSVLAQHLFRHFSDWGYKNVIFDIGGSFKKLALLLPPERALFFSYEPGKALPINPFSLNDEVEITFEKYKSLSELLFKLAYPEEVMTEATATAIINILKTYYTNQEGNYNLQTFYNFVYSNKETLLNHLEIKEEYFDVDAWLFNCGKFVVNAKGDEGLYSFLFQMNEDQSHLIDEKDFIVFEFDKAQDDPVALSILMLLGTEAVQKLIWEDKSIPGVIFFDELAKFIKYKSIRDRVVFFYQAIRKQNAAVGSALQSPAQLPIGDDTNAMIDNNQVLYVLFNEKGYEPLVNRFRLSAHQHNILNSLTSVRETNKNYVEFALIIGKDIWVHRLELPKLVLNAYQTDGEAYDWMMKEFERTGSMEEAILRYTNLGE